jgi:hypothetical protein
MAFGLQQASKNRAVVWLCLIMWSCSRSIFLLCLTLLLLRTTRGAVLSTPISISQTEALNVTLTGGVPSQFSAIPQPERGEPLDKWDFLELAIKIVAFLARLDFTKQIQPNRWSADAPSGLVIATSLSGTRRGVRGIEARYVIWGIYEAVKAVINNDVPHATIYLLKWQGNTVGTLAFYHPWTLSLPRNDTIDNITHDVPYASLSNITDPAPLVAPSSNISVLATLTPGLRVAYGMVSGPNDHSLNPNGVFINILSLLLETAEHSANMAIRSPFTAPIGSYDAVEATVSGSGSHKSMTQPPFFEYEHLCEGLAGLSIELVRLRRRPQPDEFFDEFKLVFFMYNVEIGVVHFHPGG